MYYTLQQLAAKIDRTDQTLRLHIRRQWLKAEKVPGARGWRVKANDAHKWAAKHFGVDLTATAQLPQV